MKKILVIGSLNMDISLKMDRAPEAGETLTADTLCISPGGKGANQAYAAGKLGGSVTMLGAVGKDAYGEALCESLRSVGVDVSCIRRVEGVSTGTAVIFVEKGGENRIAIVKGANEWVDIEYIDQHLDRIRDCDILVMQLEIPMDTVVYAAKLASSLGKTVILDPAPAVADIPAELWQYVDYTKPNETELSIILTGQADQIAKTEVSAYAKKLKAKNVWVTLGGKGVLLRKADGSECFVPAFRVKAVDTTAAGDTFLAAAAVSLAEGAQADGAARFGNAAAALAVTKHGAHQSVPTRQEVEAFLVAQE